MVKIKFKDLSWPLKMAMIGGFIYTAITIFVIVVGGIGALLV